jgi:four helix bundle protein
MSFAIDQENSSVRGERSHSDLIAWRKAMDLVEGVYQESKSWPAEERFGLIAQIRRAVISVPANIAEGSGRTGPAEFRRHLSIAHGSLREVQTLLEVASRLGIMTQPNAVGLLAMSDEVSRVLRGLIRSLDPNRQSVLTHDSHLTTYDPKGGRDG